MHSGERCGIAAVSTAVARPSFALTPPAHMGGGMGGVGVVSKNRDSPAFHLPRADCAKRE